MLRFVRKSGFQPSAAPAAEPFCADCGPLRGDYGSLRVAAERSSVAGKSLRVAAEPLRVAAEWSGVAGKWLRVAGKSLRVAAGRPGVAAGLFRVAGKPSGASLFSAVHDSRTNQPTTMKK